MNLNKLLDMAHSPVQNYVIPGLTSYLIGKPSATHGTTRLFHNERLHEEAVVPHSHRFHLMCQVLEGRVQNNIWTKSDEGDLFQLSCQKYGGEFGKYELEHIRRERYLALPSFYKTGDWYEMSPTDIHSIYFERDTWVLFFEGPQTRTVSHILQPVVNDQVIPTFQVQPWMFQHG